MKHIVDSTPSTNTLLAQMLSTEQELDNLYTIYTPDQTAGRGQAGNSWESEPNKNLTFSTLFKISDIPVNQQFVLCQLVPIAIEAVLQKYVSDVKIKWPNDIYWKDKKLAGTLIEHTIIDQKIAYSIAGVGLNVNQKKFISDAPNPVSLSQIANREFDLDQLLDEILDMYKKMLFLLHEPQKLNMLYMSKLYRTDDFYTYQDKNGILYAKIINVADNGLITLLDKDNNHRQYAFKELKYII